MPYIGRAATNTGNVRYLDDIASGFDGSDTTFTAQVGGVNITPDQESVKIFLDGVFQHPGSGNAYTISGSTITFTAAPVANTVFSAYVVGAGAYLDDNAVSSAKLDDDAVTAAKLDDDGTGFQVGDLGVGGSLTSGDKLTVTGRLRASGGIIGDLTGNVTGNASGTALTVTQAAQTAITSVGTLTALTGGTGDLIWDTTTLVVDSSANKVGIGLTAPEAPLHILSAGNQLRLAQDSTSGHAMFSHRTDDKFSIYSFDGSAYTDILLGVDGSSAGGKVGIGVASPTDPLHVKTTAVETRISLESSTGKWAIGAEDNDKFGILNYGTSTPFIIDSSGRVGIGITSPGQVLTIKHAEPTILFIHDSTEIGFIGDCANFLTGSSPASDSFGVRSTGDFRIGTGGNNLRMTINSSGLVGIGTASPTAPLHIKAAPIQTSGARSAQLYIEDTTTHTSVQNSGIQFRQQWQSGSTTSTSAIVGTRTSTSSGNYGGALIFQTRAHGGDLADNMIIQDSGKVGIGTTAPSIGLLDVRNTGANTTVDTATVLNLKQEASSTTANIRFNTATANSAGHIIFNTDGSFQIRTDGNNLTTFANNGDVTSSGNIASENFSSETAFGGDVDTLKRAGFYRIENSASNMITGNYYSMIVAGNGSNVTSQWAVDLLGGQTYTRSFNTSWTSWARIDD